MHRHFIKQLSLVIVTSSFLTAAHAVGTGMYLGFMTGPATNSGDEEQVQVAGSTATTPANPRSNQWGSRLYMGYKMNTYASIEGGFTFISNINYDTKGVEACSSPTARVRDIELFGKAEMPLGSFSVFGKGGIAAAYTMISGPFNSPDAGDDCGQNKDDVKFKPTVAIGASYDLNQSWVVEASWTRLMVGTIIGNVDLFALGITYHFTDIYCGQFLCN